MTVPTEGAGRRHGSAARRADWWATLTPEALDDEIRENRRAERRLVPIALVAAAVTAAVLVVRVLVT